MRVSAAHMLLSVARRIRARPPSHHHPPAAAVASAAEVVGKGCGEVRGSRVVAVAVVVVRSSVVALPVQRRCHTGNGITGRNN